MRIKTILVPAATSNAFAWDENRREECGVVARAFALASCSTPHTPRTETRTAPPVFPRFAIVPLDAMLRKRGFGEQGRQVDKEIGKQVHKETGK